jgi:hypothetical protein
MSERYRNKENEWQIKRERLLRNLDTSMEWITSYAQPPRILSANSSVETYLL